MGELLVQCPFDEKVNDFLENLADNARDHVLSVWDEKFDQDNDADFDEIRDIFEQSRIRILYVGQESLEWVCYTPYEETELQMIAGLLLFESNLPSFCMRAQARSTQS